MSKVQEWQQLANKELSRREKTVDSLVQQTAEGIAIKPLYTEADLDNLEVTGTLLVCRPTFVARVPLCIPPNRGPSVSMLVFQQQKSPTLFIAVTLPPGKKVFPLRLTLPPTVATTPITHAWRATSAKRASLSTPWKI